MKNEKIFIIGLPRTGTTSICATMLTLGYTVAHTAYVQKAFNDAQVLADTPIFNDYQELDETYQNSKFIYLTRNSDKWLPSIKQLLQRMSQNLLRKDGGFNPTIKRCFTEVFKPFEFESISNDDFLLKCYEKHQNEVLSYFQNRKSDLLILNISEKDSYSRLLTFLSEFSLHMKEANTKGEFPQLNKGAKVTEWKNIKHPRKIPSTKNGRIELL